MRPGFALLFAVSAFAQPPAPPYDHLILNARLIDGAGSPWFAGDLALRDGRIAAIGKLAGAPAARTLDAKGLTLAPGFIDIHSHAIAGIQTNPAAENLIRQGVTTVLEGQDGGSPLPLGPFLDRLAKLPIAVNYASLAGHNAIRRAVMGTENRHARPEELERMRALAAEAMRQGAFGLSTGLFYVPGNYAPTEEVIAIARAVAPLGGIHVSHMRDETAAGLLASVRETIRIGEEGGLPTQVTHHKAIGKAAWGLPRETLKLITEARARGVDVTLDQYPYTASSTGLAALFPQWALAGGAAALKECLAAPESRAKIKAEIVFRILNDRGAGDPANIVIASCEHDPALAGQSLAAITRARGQQPTPENAADAAIALQLQGGCSAIYHAISEDDVELILKYPFTMVASDGGIPSFGVAAPHPRSYGTFARVLERYVRERAVLTLEEAVRRMTSLPAQRLNLQDRGLLRAGMRADLVLFDPAAIAARTTFEEPHQYAVGVHSVWVNGVLTLDAGRMTGARGGQVLRGPAWRPPQP
jgi:dihydroorotase/N-acyl-D-amino-acid deacylase